MDTRIRNSAGTMLLLAGLPAMAQETAAMKASGVVNCPTCPPGSVTPPGDPTMLIAGAFIVGVIVGAVVARAFAKKQ